MLHYEDYPQNEDENDLLPAQNEVDDRGLDGESVYLLVEDPASPIATRLHSTRQDEYSTSQIRYRSSYRLGTIRVRLGTGVVQNACWCRDSEYGRRRRKDVNGLMTRTNVNIYKGVDLCYQVAIITG